MFPEIVISGILLTVGIAALLIIHFCIVRRGASPPGPPDGTSNPAGEPRGNRRMNREDIQRLPSFHYRVEEAPEEGMNSECAVCLECFRDGEACRVLPKCGHSFHTECIDSWLLKTGSCPICRTATKSPLLHQSQT